MHRVRPRDCCLGMIQSLNWTAIYIKLHHGLSYKMTPGDEVEDMFLLLNEVKRRIPTVAAVSSGTIASDYQRLRVESVCSRLGLVSFSYLWKQDQSMLLQEMIASGIIAIMVKVAAVGLHPAKHLGKELADLKTHLHHLKGLYGSNVCGEGGEYETLTLDCPLFKATLHHGILHLAGQLGLDPPTMTLCDGGIISELEQALFNSEAIADCFHCSISSSAISFIVYCSIQTVSLNRDEVQDKWVRFLEQLKKHHSAKGSVSKVFDPILLFVLVPQLPKRALVEVKPTLFIEEDTESDSDICIQGLAHVTPQHYWGFQEDPWHDSCLQQCIVQGNVCAVMLSIASENIANICDETLVPGHSLYEAQTEKVAKFCIYVIDKILTVNLFSWENAMVSK